MLSRRAPFVSRFRTGAAAAGRSTDDLEVIVPTFAAPGSTSDEVQEWREMARMQVAFYGSTPNYAFIFDQLDREGTTARIRERQKAGDLAGMTAIIDDDLLEHFCISGDWGDVTDRLIDRYQGTATRVVYYFAGMAWSRNDTNSARGASSPEPYNNPTRRPRPRPRVPNHRPGRPREAPPAAAHEPVNRQTGPDRDDRRRWRDQPGGMRSTQTRPADSPGSSPPSNGEPRG